MNFNLWDLNYLTTSELDEIIHLKKSLSLTEDQAIERWANEHPGRIKKVGEIKNNQIQTNEITEDGVKEYNGADALVKIIEDAIKNKDK